jgi:hypothetical protein
VLLPYRLMQRMAGIRSRRSFEWHAFHINVSWESHSFAASGQSFDYTDLIRSTHFVPSSPADMIEFSDVTL